VGKTDETKRKANARTKQSAAQKHRPETLSLSRTLSLSVVVFKADLSLQPLSCLFCVGENNRVLTHNKEEAKKLEQSRGVKKYEQKLL
jgi:hypothetical protein